MIYRPFIKRVVERIEIDYREIEVLGKMTKNSTGVTFNVFKTAFI